MSNPVIGQRVEIVVLINSIYQYHSGEILAIVDPYMVSVLSKSGKVFVVKNVELIPVVSEMQE
jgi:hypothetical protein